ncbi:hypothetical protein EGW08_017431 [Elysia chlorotica]|uniref:Uncharacterized protein n=1 Tax=Elysia chlorotica TaxID=188477 RepID=A0A433SZV4_ELYCH|nr:hypothetical protein EGW08_017431 [Elysia chlorotica]
MPSFSLVTCILKSKDAGGQHMLKHAEAVANIQKQQQPNKPEATSSAKPTTPKSPVKLKFHKMSGKKNHFRASPSVSNMPGSNKKSISQRNLPGSGSRGRKRSSDPFSASGYTSAKRSRRSKEVKATTKRSNFCSVTSETVDIVTTTGLLSPSLQATVTESTSGLSLTSTSSASESASMSVSTIDTSATASAPGQLDGDSSETISATEDDQVFKAPPEAEKINILSESKPSIDGSQQLNIEEDVISAEEIVRLSSDENFLLSDVNESAAGSVVRKVGPSPNNIHLSSGPSDFSERERKPETLKPVTRDEKETSFAIERSHDQECLWGGACNRSDCRSNRRRNMKNGQGEDSKETGSGQSRDKAAEESVSSESISSSTNSNSASSTTASPSTPAKRLTSGTSIAKPFIASTSTLQQQNMSDAGDSSGSVNQPQVSSPSAITPSSAGGKSKVMPRSIAESPRAHSSDSSFDDSPQSGFPPDAQLNKQVVSDAFRRVNSPSRQANVEASASNTSSGKSVVSSTTTRQPSGHRNQSGLRKAVGAGPEVMERPGLFSEGNSAFSFARQDSGFAGDSPGSATVLPSPTNSINFSSPGKENFRNVAGPIAGFVQPVSSSSRLAYQSHVPMEVERTDVQPDSTVAAVSASPVPVANHPRNCPEPQRKRNFDLPLEKIPSPNSKKESDIDKRISTLTCDDLEDFIDQGEDRFGQKDSGFITNADLLQAVNLNKAEVVKRAIRLSCSSDNRLDFEQPDNTGLTLLMKAVQKGSIAITEMLLEHGVKVNSQQTNGVTALMMAAEQNNTGLVALLLKYGANSSLVTINSDQAETAIMKAIKRQQKEVVSLMLRVGVNLAAPTCTSLSVLDFAIERRNPQIEALVRTHSQRLDQAFRSRVLATLGDTVELKDPLFALQCFPLREAQEFEVKFNSFIHPLAAGEGFILFIAHTKINDKGVRCRFHGGCPISSVVLNGITQSPLTKEVNFVTSCHPIVTGCNTLKIYKQADYTSKAKLLVQAFRAKLLPC